MRSFRLVVFSCGDKSIGDAEQGVVWVIDVGSFVRCLQERFEENMGRRIESNDLVVNAGLQKKKCGGEREWYHRYYSISL